MTKEEKMLFEQNYSGINMSIELVQELLGYLNICRCDGGKQIILKCNFRKISNNKFDFDGISIIENKKENRCIKGTLTIYKNKITINQEITKLYGEKLKTEIVNTKDILVKENDIIYRKSILSGREYIDEIKDIKKSYRKY